MLNSFPMNRSATRSAFTLVELLVVITIIAILTGLLIVAASSAILAGKRASIKATMNNMDAALEDYKNTLGSYPPATQTDGTGGLSDDKILSAFKRHLKKAYPQHREPEGLIEALVGMNTSGDTNANLPGGMTAAEALVFFLTRMSDDLRYPISGAGGPSYLVDESNDAPAPNEQDPLDSRSWWMELKTEQLGPRGDDGYFDGTYNRFITYNDPQSGDTRRINFWYFKDNNDVSPFLYFDASRGSGVDSSNDTPASIVGGYTGPDAEILNELVNVYAIKTESSNANAANPFVFANKGKFQILHCGVDDLWGVMPSVNDAAVITYPAGPWTGDIRDTLTNFTDGTLEDAQP